jgi:hypothetical protein
MTTTQRRIALLTGASLATLGVAAPAAAAPFAFDIHGGIVHAGVTATDTLAIECIDTVAPIVNDICGITSSGTLASGPVIVTGPFGQIFQTGDAGGAASLILNAYETGVDFVGADLAATFTTGDGSIFDSPLQPLLVQTGINADEISITLNNEGALTLGARANLVAVGHQGNIDLQMAGGVVQHAATGDTANLLATNDGGLSIIAEGQALAAYGTVNVDVGTAFVQSATGVNAANVAFINTDGSYFTAAATMTATEGDAVANADIDGVHQIAIGATTANATYENYGTLNVVATANAFSPARAEANAHVTYGIEQTAHVIGSGDATARVDNHGAINIAAIAHAGGVFTGAYDTAATFASANASVGNGIVQHATVADLGTASAVITNDAGATIGVLASAYATASGHAEAHATVGTEGGAGINQNASGLAANANIANAGAVDVGAVAAAAGTDALAVARINDGIVQNVTATGTYATDEGAILVGDASAGLTNGGSINIHATANATAAGNLYDTGDAVAVAGIFVGIDQDVHAASGGSASATIANAGTIDIGASANAVGDTDAFAFGLMARGIDQEATADVAVTGVYGTLGLGGYVTAATAGNAMASLTNGGTINVGVAANATGYDSAVAAALMVGGIHQSANAGATVVGTGATATNMGGDASAYMTNAAAGVINIGAAANASAVSGEAHAIAGFFSGIAQYANADAGDANVTLDNAGAINITAAATAAGPRATVVSTGDFSSTHVVFGDADAAANIGRGIWQ